MRKRIHWKRRGVAFLMALFVMAVCSLICISILDTQMLQFASLRNTMEYDRARYLAEAAVQHALSEIEEDYDIPGTPEERIPWTNFPDSNNQYRATLSDGGSGTILIDAEGRSGQFTRRLLIQIKMGG